MEAGASGAGVVGFGGASSPSTRRRARQGALRLDGPVYPLKESVKPLGFNFESNADEFTLCFPQGDGNEETEETCLSTDAATNWQNPLDFEQVVRVKSFDRDAQRPSKLLLRNNRIRSLVLVLQPLLLSV